MYYDNKSTMIYKCKVSVNLIKIISLYINNTKCVNSTENCCLCYEYYNNNKKNVRTSFDRIYRLVIFETLIHLDFLSK